MLQYQRVSGYSSVGPERAVWDREAAGSSPATPTRKVLFTKGGQQLSSRVRNCLESTIYLTSEVSLVVLDAKGAERRVACYPDQKKTLPAKSDRQTMGESLQQKSQITSLSRIQTHISA